MFCELVVEVGDSPFGVSRHIVGVLEASTLNATQNAAQVKKFQKAFCEALFGVEPNPQCHVCLGSIATELSLSGHFRSSSRNGHCQTGSDWQLRADSVEKAENCISPNF